MDIVIKNGIVVTESEIMRADVGIKSGKIVAIAEKIDNVEKEIDAKDKFVMPAGVEIHTHIEAPLFNMVTVDDWYDSSVGAAFGGTATIVDYILQDPNMSLRNTIGQYQEKAKGRSIADYSFSPIIVQWSEETFEEIPGLIEDGTTTSFKVFLYYPWHVNDYNLARVLETVGNNGGIACFHCEVAGTIDYLIEKALKEGKTEPRWHAATRPVSTEVEAVERVIAVASELGVPAFIVHVSAAPVIGQLAEARARGVNVFGEAMPHYLCLDDSAYLKPGNEAMKVKITPPIRAKDHQQVLWEGLRIGALETLGSDHCAFPFKDKVRLFEKFDKKFNMIPDGAPGIETRMPIIFSEGVLKGRLSLNRFVAVTAANPAKIAGLYPQKGTLAIGSDADITIFDPETEKTISVDILHGKTDFTPFEGFKVKGWPSMTMSRGNILIQDNNVLAEPGCGKLLKRKKFETF
jgi:dihydropyrimidinase